MKPEIEAKFINVNFDDIRARLTTLGGICKQPMRLMRRVIIESDFIKSSGKDAFIRVRDEGDKVTMTYKVFKDMSLSGAEEREVVVSDFDDTVAILKEGGLDYRSYQESRRETWELNGVEIVLDEWPWINPYIEIEAKSEKEVQNVAEQLKFNWNDAIFGSADSVYKITYPHGKNRGVIDIKEVRFEDPVPELLGQRVQ